MRLLGTALLFAVPTGALAVSARDAPAPEEAQVLVALTDGRQAHARIRKLANELQDARKIDPDRAKIKQLNSKLTSEIGLRDGHLQRALDLAVKHYGLAPAKDSGTRTRFKKLKNLPWWNSAAGTTISWTSPELWTGGNPTIRFEEGRFGAAWRFLREGKEELRGLRWSRFNAWKKRFRRGVLFGGLLGEDIIAQTLPDGSIFVNLTWLVKQDEKGNFVLSQNLLAATLFHELVHFEQLLDPKSEDLSKQQIEFRAYQAGITASASLGLSASETEWVKSGLPLGVADESAGFHLGTSKAAEPSAAPGGEGEGPAPSKSRAGEPTSDGCSGGPSWVQFECQARLHLERNLRQARQAQPAAAAAAPASAAPIRAVSAAPPLRKTAAARPVTPSVAPSPARTTPRPPERPRCRYQGDWCR